MVLVDAFCRSVLLSACCLAVMAISLSAEPQTNLANAAAPLTLTTARDYRSVFDGHADILFDSTRSLTPEQAMAHPTGWRRMTSEEDIKSFTGYTYWIRFRVRATPEAARALHGEAMLAIPFSYARHLDCYLLNAATTGTTSYSVQYSGLDVPVDDRPVWWFGNTFRIPLDTTQRVVFLRCEGIAAMMTQGYIVSEVQILSVISWIRSFSVASAGILLALFLYNILLYGIVRDRVYLYYLGYLTFFGGFFIFFESAFLLEIPLFSRFVAGKNPLAFLPFVHLGFACILLFTNALLMLPTVAPRWSKVIRVLTVVQCVCMLVEWSVVGADRYRTFPIIYPLANLICLVTVGGIFVAAVLALRKKVFIAWYYLSGWMLIFIAFVGFNAAIFNTTHFKFFTGNVLFRLGITLEMIIFSVALAERIRVLQREKALAGERERERIFRDLHDGLGSQIVEIAAMSEQLRDEVRVLQEDNSVPQQGMEWATTIADSVHTLRNGLRETIWVLNAENDTAEALVSYLHIETRRMLETSPVEVQYDIPAVFPKKTVPPETRRNIVMAVREACTNMMKHAESKQIRITATLEHSLLTLTLTDDGKGFDTTSVERFSNGLKTMEKRMSLVNGAVRIASERGRGTTVQFSVPL